MASSAASGGRQAVRLAAAGLAVALLCAAADLGAGALLGRSAGWQAAQDPRERILWDASHDAPVVLVGDSSFCSYYVDSLSDALWSRLAARLRVAVFPGALNGASADDVLLVTRRVADLWPAGTTVIVGIHPARLFVPGAAALPPQSAATRHVADLPRLVFAPDAGTGAVARADEWLRVGLANRSFLVRNAEWVAHYLDASLKGRPDWKMVPQGDRRWDNGDDFAADTFRRLEAIVAAGGDRQMVPFGWVEQMQRTLEAQGLRPVFLLTPLNSALLRRYSTPDAPLWKALAASHAFLVDRLVERRYQFVDLFEAVGSEGFADLIHTNAAGDDRLAERLAQWLESRNGWRVQPR